MASFDMSWLNKTSLNKASFSRLALASALALACLAGEVRAQAPTPGAIAAARELVTLKGAAAMFNPLIPGVIESAKNSFLPTNPQLAKPLEEEAVALRKEYAARLNEVVDEVAKVYAQHFTEAELKDYIAFYKTPAGKKLITEEPRVLEDGMKAAQGWATQFSDTVLERFRVDFKKKGLTL
jgi:hypothetical protein